MVEKKCVPDVRLSQFDSDWIEHSVGELLTERVDFSPKSDEYPLMAFVANQGIVPKGERYDRSALVTDTENKLYKKTELGDFIYSSNNLESGSIGLNNYGKATISPVYSIFKSTELGVSSFLGQRLVRNDFIKEMVKWRQGVVYGQWRIHEDDFERLTVNVPSVDEQTEIGSFMCQVDNLIFDSQKRLDKLYNVRAFMLEKMFPQGEAEVPEVRFKEFTGTWKRKRFSELYESVAQKNDLTYGVDKIISVANMYFKPDAYVTDPEYLLTYNVFQLGDIAFEGNKSKHFAHGRFVENTIGTGIISHVFDVFRPIDEYDLLYWKYAINNEQIMGPILVRCTKASTMMTNLVAKDFMEESILVPAIEEQRKIGAALSEMDHFIALRKRELDKLHSLKKGLLEKMFV